MQRAPTKKMDLRHELSLQPFEFCILKQIISATRKMLAHAIQMVSQLLFGAIPFGRPTTATATTNNSTNAPRCIRTKKTHHPFFATFIVLPLLFALLLPTLKLEDDNSSSNKAHQQVTANSLPWAFTNDILLPLLRFPFDRLRLVSGFGVALAKEINSRRDLQEEETQMMMLAPAEHRATYLAPTSYQQQVTRAQGGEPTQLAPSTETGGGHLVSEYPGGSGVGGEVVEAPAGTVEGTVEPTSSGVAPTSGTSLQTRNDLPAVRALNVKCEKNHMTVNIVFDRPFYGLVFSKGHYNDQKCIHLPANSGQTSVNFDIHLGKCGMSSSDASGTAFGANGLQQQQAGSQQPQPNGLYIENTIIIQYDPQVQEIYDQARKLRCTWYDYYEKSVTFRPYNVDMLDAVTANFLGDNIQCWMQIQVGKGPWSSEVAGIVKIGQTMTMVLAIKDDENRFDMLVRNCVAHDGKHQPIQLVDEYGCVARPKIMARFQKVRNFGPAATVVSYAHFQAFKFPDSMSVHFQCVIQVCRYECPEPVCSQASGAGELTSGPTGGNPQAGDYAASGTELISSKEQPIPGTAYLLANHSSMRPSSSSGVGHAQSALKLDESQGRVQVKLDTSMMAALGRAQAPQQPAVLHNGPLPPHLLHTAASDSDQVAHSSGHSTNQIPSRTYLASSAPYYSSKATGINIRPGASGGLNGRPQSAPPSQQQQLHLSPGVHYSSPYPSQQIHHRSVANLYATNRLGELAPTGNHREDHEEGVNPLSLMATPRALRMAAPTNATSLPISNEHHSRKRRAVSIPGEPEGGSFKLHRDSRASDQSTAVRTQKTIQVVSPDDVAFSLLAADELQPQTITANNNPSRYHSTSRAQQQVNVEDLSTVCFSATRLILAILVTLALLATSIVIVAFVILKQRSQLEEKLSAVYEESPAAQAATTTTHSQCQLGGQMDLGGNRRFQDEDLVSRRQREEIQQRNRCLTRLYSQFMPATYWQR